MTDGEIKEFSLRISQSNRTEIVVISYEIILNYIESAKKCYKEGKLDDVVKNLKKAKQFVNDLSSNLDFKYGISGELMSLYRFTNTTLLNNIIKRNVDGLEIVEKIMTKLRESFIEVAKIDNRGTAIKGGGQVYAGLTYGNNSKLNECVMPLTK